MERRVIVRPAFDKRETGHGIHGAEILFLLQGDEGAIQFLIFTHWHLPHLGKELYRPPTNG